MFKNNSKVSAAEVTANATRASKAVPPRVEMVRHQPQQQQRKKESREEKAKQRQKVDKAAKRAANRKVTGGELGDYFYALDNPFDCLGARCPINYNPAPSFIQTTARTTVTRPAFTVPQGASSTLVLMPGHIEQITGAIAAASLNGASDPTAFHHSAFRMSGEPTTYRIIGPINGTYDNAGPVSTIAGIGYALPGTIGNYNINIATAGWSYFTYDGPLPYSYSGTAGHARWQLVSMGLRVRNITTALNRGGSVCTVVPNSDVALASASILNLAIFPSFRDHGDASDGVYVKWIPRGGDMAFWHDACVAGSSTPITSGLDMHNPGILCVLNNNTATPQSYDIEIVCNWQIAGNLINVIGGAAPHIPELKNVVEPVVSHALQSHASTSTTFGKIGNALATLGSVVMGHDPTAPGPSLATKMTGAAIKLGMHAAGFH